MRLRVLRYLNDWYMGSVIDGKKLVPYRSAEYKPRDMTWIPIAHPPHPGKAEVKAVIAALRKELTK